MSTKLIQYTLPEIEHLLATALAVEGKVPVRTTWLEPPPAGVEVEYIPAPAVPGTEEQLSLRAVLVERAAVLLEQCQQAGLDVEADVLSQARVRFAERAIRAGRMPETAHAT